jgi:pyruvate dehydrogenase E2 component (dihydrolipoamide acetyltransferase)
MAEELFIPQLGQTVEEVTIINWLVEDGAKVDFGTPILDVETDKAVFPVEANASGYLHRGPFNEGDVVKVLTTVATIGKKDDVFKSSEVSATQPASISRSSTGDLEQSVEIDQTIATGQSSVLETQPMNEKIFISPRAKKLAIEEKVDISGITPTGGDGARIAERDVINYLSHQPKATPLAQNIAQKEGIDLSTIEGTGIRGTITKTDVELKVKSRSIDQEVPGAQTIPSSTENLITNSVPLKGVRKIIFERMAESVHTTARVTLIVETDATLFVQAREQIKKSVSEEWGFSPGYNDLLALIVARCLREYPYMNARLSPDGSEIQWLKDINLGLAVDTERGLIVPVIRKADMKNLNEFGSEFRALVERARAGRSLPDDLANGTFTITNLGIFDVDAFTPVINLPELAILGIGKIALKVVPIDGETAIRHRMTLSLVFDHRLVDGAPAARFLQRIKQYIENPFLLLG